MKSYKTIFKFFFMLAVTCHGDDRAVAEHKLEKIHKTLHMKHGGLDCEYEEQLMSVMFIPHDAKVLELGTNVGRNSCIIGRILSNSRNLITLESNPVWADQARQNAKANNLNYIVISKALSRRPLIQKGWDTIESITLLPGYEKVDTITYDEIKNMFQIKFDTLVIDCEGAFYNILQDEPNILDGIKLIIIENDFGSDQKMNYVHDRFKEAGFELAYERPYYTYTHFYQTWKRNI